MNIFGLYEKLNLHPDRATSYSPEELIRIEKKINVEKRLNPEIDVNVASQLIEALRNAPAALFFFANHRVLYNYFAATRYDKSHFSEVYCSIPDEELKAFLENYLNDDLMLFFEQRLSNNAFNEMNDVLVFKKYFPESILFKIGKKAMVKTETAISHLSKSQDGAAELPFIRQKSFYDFLSHFNSIEMDEKLKSLLNLSVDGYNNVNKSAYGPIIMSMTYYDAFDEDFSATLKKNRNVINSNQSLSSKSGSGINWRVFALIVFALLKIAFFTNKCSSGTSQPYLRNDNETFYQTGNEPLDRYYTDMQRNMDTLYNYLAGYKTGEKINLHFNDSIKTGDNPFYNYFKPYQKTESNAGIKCYNNSAYDVVVLESYVVYDSIKLPSKAFFIKSKAVFEYCAESGHNLVYNIYAGKKLASFHIENEKILVRNNSVEEPRFTELAANASELLHTDHKFTSTVFIESKNGTVTVRSAALEEKPNSKQAEIVVEEPPLVVPLEDKGR